jgi:hypothetical protein
MKMKATLASIAIAIIAGATVAGAGTVKAQPGLWKAAMTQKRSGQPAVRRVQTRCITQEEIDGLAQKFAKPPPNSPQETCKQTNFKETIDSIDWKMDCTGQFAMSNEGSIKFDKLSHYSGTIKMHGTMNGNPVESEIIVEGRRVGECTGKENPTGQASPAPTKGTQPH